MQAFVRWARSALLLAGVTASMAACLAGWSGAREGATLLVGAPIILAGKGEVLVSVANMPSGGLAAIAIDDLGITYTDIAPASIEASGLHGFTVLAQDFTSTPGKGRLVAANPSSGSVGGTILRIRFETGGGAPTFAIRPEDKDKVALGSAANTRIASWDLGTGQAYYAR